MDAAGAALEGGLKTFQVQAVVDIASVSRAPPLADDPGSPQLTEVIRHQVGGLADGGNELVHLAVARGQDRDQTPAHLIVEEFEQRLPLDVDVAVRTTAGRHRYILSMDFESMSAMA